MNLNTVLEMPYDEWPDEVKQEIGEISKIMDDFRKRVAEGLVTLEKRCPALAEMGWTLPMRVSLKGVLQLVNTEFSPEQVDQIFVEYYSDDNGKQFEKIVNEFLSNERLKKWNQLYNGCVDAYHNNNYIVTIPCLITIIEGILSSFIETEKNSIQIMVLLSKYEKLASDNRKLQADAHESSKLHS